MYTDAHGDANPIDIAMKRRGVRQMGTIFLVEDDRALRGQLAEFLEGYGYTCTFSDDFAHIIQKALEATPDLILLDINLPYQDGYHICREIRRQSDVPIIVVTSRATDMDELMSMNLGADDFVTKPYNTQILLARIGALLRRRQQASPRQMECRGLVFFPEQGVVEYGGKRTELTKNERHILSLLLRRVGEVVTREELMEELWQSDEFVDDNTLTVNINRLRRKLAALGAEDMIATRRGQGYVL